MTLHCQLNSLENDSFAICWHRDPLFSLSFLAFSVSISDPGSSPMIYASFQTRVLCFGEVLLPSPFFRDVRFCGIHAGRVVYVNDPNLGLESVPFCGHWHVFLFLLIANGFSRCQILIIDMLTLSGGTYRATGIYQGNKSGSLTTLPPPSAFPHCVTTFWVTRGCWKRYSYRVTTEPAHKPKCPWIYGSSSVIDVLPKKYVHINVLWHFLISLLPEHFFPLFRSPAKLINFLFRGSD